VRSVAWEPKKNTG